MNFEQAKTNLIAARKAWYAGEGSEAAMNLAAEVAAKAYNDRAREIARRMGMKPRLTNARTIMRQIDQADRFRR
jgi:hypothetical protein